MKLSDKIILGYRFQQAIIIVDSLICIGLAYYRSYFLLFLFPFLVFLIYHLEVRMKPIYSLIKRSIAIEKKVDNYILYGRKVDEKEILKMLEEINYLRKEFLKLANKNNNELR